MPTIKSITPAACDLIRAELNRVLGPLAQKHGLQITVGRMGYQATNIKTSLEIAIIGAGGIAETREAQSFKMLAECSFGMKESDLGRAFTVRDTEYTLIGLKSGTKYPMQAKRTSDGAIFGFPYATVKRALGYTLTQNDIAAARR